MEAIQVTCICFVALFSVNLLFIVHNIVRYVFGLRMKQTLIVVFYAILLVNQCLRILEFTLRALFADRGFLPNIDRKIFYANCFSAISSVLLELVLIMTMFKLYLALRLIQGSLDHNQARKREYILLIFLTLFFIG